MKSTVLLILLLLVTSVNSQNNFNTDTYTVTRSDLETNTFPKDSTANALVIYEYGTTHIENTNFNLVLEQKRKIKILNRNGFDKANVSILLYNNEKRKEKIKNIIATTHNLENGKLTRVKLDPSQIFEEKQDDNYTAVKFALPNIKEGSVITYSYKLISPFKFKYKTWYFQSDIPQLYSEYNTSIPGNYVYNIKLVGSLNLATNETGLEKHCLEGGYGAMSDCFIAKYVMKDAPAFIPEDYMTTKKNYISRVEYELKTFKGFDGMIDNITKSWKDVDKELKNDNSIGKQLKKTSLVKDLLPNKITEETNSLKQAKAIYNYVQNNYTWNKEYNLFKDVSLKKLIENKSGRASEINLLLFNLLKNSGVDVKTMLTSTRSNGLPTKVFPVISDFNYLLVQAKINGESYLLDATDKYLFFGQLPFRCLNQYGRLIDLKEESYWIDFTPKKFSTKQNKIELSIDNNQNITGKINYKTKGYHALSKKRNYFNNKNEYTNNYANSQSNFEIIDHVVNVERENDEVFSEEINIKFETDGVANTIYFNPFIITYFDKNPFKLQKRTYPIDFGYKDIYTYALKFTYDNAIYDLLELPENKSYNLPNNKGSLVLNFTEKDNELIMFFKFNFKEALYNKNYYPYLKEYFNIIVDIQKNTLITLKKK